MYGFCTVKVLNFFRRYFAVIFLVSTFCAGYVIFSWKSENTLHLDIPEPTHTCSYLMPVVKFHGITETERTLDILKNLFRKMGYRIDFSGLLDWDVLWSHIYPFSPETNNLANLKPNQKVNHFPGSGFITQKSSLASLNIENFPKSFILPNDREYFLDFARKNPNKAWILKSSAHRGMRLINGTQKFDVKGSFIQEFIKYPLLISEKKFDIGVYVMLTSVDPLRVYIYSEDILLRFCTKDYYPINIDSPESYIVGDDYLPIWEVGDLKFYFSELNYTAKETFNAYLESKGKHPKRLWSQIYDTIQNVYLQTEDNFKSSAMKLGSLRNFFELVRFDFLADEDLNIFLLEVNMSPNLSPAHFPLNHLLYEQIVFNSLNLVSLVRKFPDSVSYRGEAVVSEKDIQVFSEQCASQTCQISCKSFKCSICNQCMNMEMKEIAKSAYLEFMNRGKYRRILPPPTVGANGENNYIRISPSSAMNAFMDLWFKGKCLQDVSWCH